MFFALAASGHEDVKQFVGNDQATVAGDSEKGADEVTNRHSCWPYETVFSVVKYSGNSKFDNVVHGKKHV